MTDDRQRPRSVAQRESHVHAEAFCLMYYQCEKCYIVELIWNSRDGVTPFIINCVACGGAMRHENWHLDKYLPDYVPQPGQRYFIDLTWPSYFRKMRANAGPAYEAAGQKLTKKVLEKWWKDVEPGAPDIATAKAIRQSRKALDSLRRCH